MGVHRINHKDYLSLADNSINYFEIAGRKANDDKAVTKDSFHDWGENAIDIGDYKVIPFGKDNDIPKQIQQAVFPNSLGPRLQNRKVELLNGQGPYLYKHVIDGTKFTREPVENAAISEFLRSIDHENILLHNAIDYYYQNAVFSKILRDRSARIGGDSQMASIQMLSAFDCRLAYRQNDKKKRPTHVIVGDWEKSDQQEFMVYPLFDVMEPNKHKVSVHYTHTFSYGMHDYALPEIYGALEWIKRSSAVPRILKALSDNSLNIKWHIKSPAKYWEEKDEAIRINCAANNKEYKASMLENLKSEILDKLSELLSGEENVGKFWHNEHVKEIVGGTAVEHGWEIIPIEQKVEEYIKGQLLIAEKADFATVASFGLQTALANVGADGKSDSGSEQLYAYQIHQITSTNLPEFHVCKAINDCLRLKFNTDIRVGFYQISADRQQDVTNSQRITNQTPQI